MDHKTCAGCAGSSQQPRLNRRTVLIDAGLIGAGLISAGAAAVVTSGSARADDEDNPEAVAPPKADDILIQATGADAGKPIGPDAFITPNTLIQAWAKDPKSGLVRKGSRLNRVLLIRIDPASMNEDTKVRSVQGIIAYSDFCVHAGCWIETYHAQENAILCHCHSSMYDPRNSARVVGGPAKGPLAALPLKLVDGHLAAAAAFIGHLGIIT